MPTVLHVRVDEDTRRLLNDLAYAESRPLNSVVQRALRLYAEDSADYHDLLRERQEANKNVAAEVRAAHRR